MLAGLLEVLAGTTEGDAVLAQDAAGVLDAVGAVVADVVVGQRQEVDAGAREDLGQRGLAR